VRVASLLLWASLVAACGPSIDASTRRAYTRWRVPASECRAPGPAEVGPAAMRADWAHLRTLLERGYAGYPLAADEAGWARVFEDGEAALPTEPVEAIAFRDFLVERLRFVDDNHMGFWVRGPDRRRRWRSTSAHHLAHRSDVSFERRDGEWVDPGGRPLARCGDRPAADLVRPVWTDEGLERRVVVRSPEPLAELSCTLGGEAVALPVRAWTRRRDRGAAFERRDAEFPWLRVRSLGMARRDALERFVQSAALVRDEDVVVLDVRGNGGGSDRFLLRWFRALTAQDLRYFDTLRINSEVELQGAATFWGCQGALASGDGAGSAWIRSRVRQAEQERERAMAERGPFVERIEGHYVERGRAPSRFEGRLVLLTDRGCGSACETSVLLARQLPGALIVGENTEGTMKVGELRFYRLPDTGVWVSIGRRVHRDPATGTFPEGRGYAPDVWLDAIDPDAAVRRLVACLRDARCAATLPSPTRPPIAPAPED